MYTKYFGYNEKPFTLTPNPRFIFLSKIHKEAFAHLLYGINNHYGFIELIGEVGTGKTTVLRTLLNQLQDENYRSALIFNPCMTGLELLRNINQEFGIDSSSEYTNELVASLNRFLLAENREGRTVVLVIDEAQNLHIEVLEQVRLISNLETENDKLIQIILAGQPELEHLLERPELRQLNQRIAVRYKLRSLTMDETRSYIRHRMEVAGETGGVSFSNYATKWIYFYTRGIPRMINILCDRSLLIAYGDERRSISVAIVMRAIRELFNIGHYRRLFVAAGIIAFLAVGAAARWLPEKMRHGSSPSASAESRKQEAVALPQPLIVPAVSAIASVAIPPPISAAKNPSVTMLEDELLGSNQNDVHFTAFNALVTKWGATPLKVFKGRLRVPAMFARLAERRNLRVTLFEGNLEEALRFDLPMLAATRVIGDLGNYCLAVVYEEGDSLKILPKLSSGKMIKKDDVAEIASGTYYLIWENFGQIPDKINPGDRKFEIMALQRLLKQAGFYHHQIDGSYNRATVKGVREFQLSRGISADDTVGELTLAALTKFDKTHAIPSLKRK